MANAKLALFALGDETRRTIFEKLRNKPMAVVQIANGLPVSRPAVSQHLRVLKEAKLIRMERRGNQSVYQVDTEGMQAIYDYLDKFWDRALLSFKAAAEAEAKKKKKI